ncbi:MAG: hypothetical protein ACP5G8_08330 [Athalassotoga sp.]
MNILVPEDVAVETISIFSKQLGHIHTDETVELQAPSNVIKIPDQAFIRNMQKKRSGKVR